MQSDVKDWRKDGKFNSLQKYDTSNDLLKFLHHLVRLQIHRKPLSYASEPNRASSFKKLPAFTSSVLP